MEKNREVIVIGGGPAGMMAAGTAAARGLQVTLIEQNKILGKKLLITGKGRCNLTNACEDVKTLIQNVPTNGRFLYSAFHSFDNWQTIAFFEGLGVATKTERGNRVFPVSDKSRDVADALVTYLKRQRVEILCDRVDEILRDDAGVCGVRTKMRGILPARCVILATGGLSYQKTGSTGDGYTWAEELGHTITDIRPSLVPLTVAEDWCAELAGLSLKNIAVQVIDQTGRLVYRDFGEMMFAHFGLTGPVILSASAHMRDMRGSRYRLLVDLKPALDEEKLGQRLLRDFQKYQNKEFKNSLKDLLPSSLIGTVVALSGIDPYKKVNAVTREERHALVSVLKRLPFHVTGFCPIEQAIITSGGVCVKEINPSTMQSKLVSGLYFAGEIIDVDAYTGGFNLQIAFSTGFLAGASC